MRTILRELPRRRVALVLLGVLVNVGVVSGARGLQVAKEREARGLQIQCS